MNNVPSQHGNVIANGFVIVLRAFLLHENQWHARLLKDLCINCTYKAMRIVIRTNYWVKQSPINPFLEAPICSFLRVVFPAVHIVSFQCVNRMKRSYGFDSYAILLSAAFMYCFSSLTHENLSNMAIHYGKAYFYQRD